MEHKTINIKVPVLARVEGEGALELAIQNNRITDLKLNIYEPPRFFEKFLEGRSQHEVIDIVARICGICPVAYQMSAVHAIESILQISPGPWVRAMRRLMYCGEWIESHALHIHLLAAPDYLGFDSALSMAEQYPAEVRRGLRLQNLGNQIIRLLGGRSVHPIGVRVGGFHHAPTIKEIERLKQDLIAARTEAQALISWTASLEFPDDEQDFTSVALQHPDEYPMNEGRIIASDGLNIDISEYQQHFAETHVAHSTALHSHLHGAPYLVGPLARLNLNHQQIPANILALADQAGIRFPSRNMFHSIVARAVEIAYALEEAQHHSRMSPLRLLPVRDSVVLRHHAAFFGIVMIWMTRETSRRPSSSPLPARTRHASNRICAGHWKNPGWIMMNTPCVCSAKKSFATTIPASPARPTS